MRKPALLLVPLLLLLVAYALRVHLLGAQSLWYDEGVAYGHSQRTLLQMIPMLQRNVHVPAYFASLAYWEDLAGSSEFALRYLSVMFSVASVAFSYALGRRLYGHVAGVAALGFVAFNTFSIYYAQEARMYAMLAAVAAGSMCVFLGWTRAYVQQKRIFTWAIALAVVNTLGMYTHFSYALVMVAQGILAALWLVCLWAGVIRLEQPYVRPTSRLIRAGLEPIYTIGTTIRALLVYSIANLITIALFSPWIEIALRQTSSQPNISDVVALDQMLRTLQGWYAFGVTFEQTLTGITIAMYFFLLFGLVTLPQQGRGQVWRMLLPVMWVLASSAIYLYLGLYTRYLRFLAPTEIAFALWMGRGVWILWSIRTRRRNRLARIIPRIGAVFATLVLWLTMLQGVLLVYSDPAYQRDDYRGLAAAIDADTQADDLVIVTAPGVQEVFGYYYKGDAPLVAYPITSNPAAEAHTLIARAEQVDVVYYGEQEQDPQRSLEYALSVGDAFPIETRWWGDVRWGRYAIADPSSLTRQTLTIRFGAQMQLESARVSADTRMVGEPILLTLDWKVLSAGTVPYQGFVQLLNSDGVLVAQRDSRLQNGFYEWTESTASDTITENHALSTDQLPPGSYTLIVGLYDPNTGQRLPVRDGDYLVLGTIIMTDAAGTR